MRRLAVNQLFKNAAALYGVQAVRKLIPLLTIPYLARVLGPEGWGAVAIALTYAQFSVLFIEFGFNMSATREIARHRESPEKCKQIVAGVVSLQLLIFLSASVVSLLLYRSVPVLHDKPGLVLAGLAFAAAQGFTPLWYLQGFERIQLGAALDITGKLLSLLCLFSFVHSPADLVPAVLAQAAAPAVTTLIGLGAMFRETPIALPSRAVLADTLNSSWPMFLLRAGTTLYGSSNIFILGFFAPPLVIGYYTAADRIITAGYGLLTPVADAFYPRVTHLIHHSRHEEGQRVALRGSIILAAIGLGLSVGLFLGAPILVQIFAGKEFAQTVTLLRIMSCTLFFAAIVLAVGTQWLLPQGRDKQMNAVVLGTGFANLFVAYLLGSRYLDVGLAWTGVVAECAVACGLLSLLRLRSHSQSADTFQASSVIS